jgi:hypothetical protein
VSRPKLSDVVWLTVDLRPVTTCEPPEGHRCFLAAGSKSFTSADAKRHALENPRHYVTRQRVQQSQFIYEPATEDAAPEGGAA